MAMPPALLPQVLTPSPDSAILPGVTYPGGKNSDGVYQRIINEIPPHETYIEPFLGSGAIMRKKRPARLTIGVDLDKPVIEQFDCDHIPHLRLIHGDGLEFLKSYSWQGSEAVYCDPPYLIETRSSQRAIYRFEFSHSQHVELLEMILKLPCYVLISGYYSELYAKALRAWRHITFKTPTRGGRMATEYVWMNYPESLELHDYQYLGDNFRERERIKRKRERWKAKLLKMPTLEQRAILASLTELRER
jgi:hypothetical protein